MAETTELQDKPIEAPEQPDDIASAASRLSGLMGDDEGAFAPPEPPEDEPEAAPEPKAETKPEPEPDDEPEFEVKVDGQTQKVKKSELLSGYQRQADYTRKTMELAEVRKQTEQAVAQYATQFQTVAQQIEGLVNSGQLAPPDPTLLDSDPVAYLKQKAQWERAQVAYQQARTQHEQIQKQAEQQRQQQLSQFLTAEKEQLLAKLPDWKDEGKAAKERAALKSHLQTLGYKAEEIDGIADHRSVLLARESMLYRQMVAEQKAAVAKKVAPAPQRAVKPGAANEAPTTQMNQAAMQRLRKGGKTDDAASVIRSLLGG